MEGTRNIDEKINVMNVAPLGFWYQLNFINISNFALQGFGGLFVELNNTIKTQAIGQGVAGQYLPNNVSWSFICNNNEIEESHCKDIW